MVVAILAAPHLREATCAYASLVKGTETPVTAIKFSLLVALEAMVVIQLVLVNNPLLLQHQALFISILATLASRCFEFVLKMVIMVNMHVSLIICVRIGVDLWS